ncbi:NUDIX domain-containing protein [bacterium]|nr:NUDIX domain-containing protein [bacterium]
MLALNLVVRAVIVHQGRLLSNVIADGQRPAFHSLLGGHLKLDETLTQAVVREVREEIGIEVLPSRLLYIAENFFARGERRMHEIGYYFLCHPASPVEGDFLASLRPDPNELVSPELLSAEELLAADFQPAGLKKVLAQDMQSKFKDCPRLVVINELPGDAAVQSGVFGL